MISVIVPVYNAERTIADCLDSLLQSKAVLEIIVVDDGSTDQSLNICEKYAEKNSNIFLVRQQNKGVSSARNEGMKQAHGEYIGFVDSDDEIDQNMFEKLINCFDEETDIAVCYFKHKKTDQGTAQPCIARSHQDMVLDIVKNPFVLGAPWNKLFRRSIISQHELRFNTEIHDMEDKLFCLEYMNCCTHGGKIIPEKLYIYKEYPEDFKRKYPFEKYKTGLDACERMLELSCVQQNKTARSFEQAILVKHCIQIARVSYRSGEKDVTLYREKAKKYKKDFMRCNLISIKQKIGYYVLQSAPFLLKWI